MRELVIPLSCFAGIAVFIWLFGMKNFLVWACGYMTGVGLLLIEHWSKF